MAALEVAHRAAKEAVDAAAVARRELAEAEEAAAMALKERAEAAAAKKERALHKKATSLTKIQVNYWCGSKPFHLNNRTTPLRYQDHCRHHPPTAPTTSATPVTAVTAITAVTAVIFATPTTAGETVLVGGDQARVTPLPPTECAREAYQGSKERLPSHVASAALRERYDGPRAKEGARQHSWPVPGRIPFVCRSFANVGEVTAKRRRS